KCRPLSRASRLENYPPRESCRSRIGIAQRTELDRRRFRASYLRSNAVSRDLPPSILLDQLKTHAAARVVNTRCQRVAARREDRVALTSSVCCLLTCCCLCWTATGRKLLVYEPREHV